MNKPIIKIIGNINQVFEQIKSICYIFGESATLSEIATKLKQDGDKMEKYLIIEKSFFNGIRIKDTISNNSITYFGYTLKRAIKEHRKKFNLRYKHFEILYI